MVKIVAVVSDIVPLATNADANVNVIVPVGVTLFQVIPLVFNVVLAEMFNVDDVVTTVPAV